MKKKTRISKMVDRKSYEEVMNVYNQVKRNKDKYTLNDLIRIKSFLGKMISVQKERYEDGTQRWRTPFDYLKEFEGNNYERKVKLLLHNRGVFLNMEGAFNYVDEIDFGKLL